ncbi:hypothetical protein FF36_05886 [Frankia torreyi]|uniref:Uncharacterized protein n=1 Tax=Frankia torreyi TaxID=1856 RepID=A0A0D8B8W6_9ACTN|nr:MULTISPECIES: hypothetical protein [Frankia]KJE19812.1 hypothetical protein FF36_05886 [Frankia torreyi]
MKVPQIVVDLREAIPENVAISWKLPGASPNLVDIEVDRDDDCFLSIWYLTKPGSARMLLEGYTIDDVRPEHVIKFVRMFAEDTFSVKLEKSWLGRRFTIYFIIDETTYAASRRARDPAPWESRHLDAD